MQGAADSVARPAREQVEAGDDRAPASSLGPVCSEVIGDPPQTLTAAPQGSRTSQALPTSNAQQPRPKPTTIRSGPRMLRRVPLLTR